MQGVSAANLSASRHQVSPETEKMDNISVAFYMHGYVVHQRSFYKNHHRSDTIGTSRTHTYTHARTRFHTKINLPISESGIFSSVRVVFVIPK